MWPRGFSPAENFRIGSPVPGWKILNRMFGQTPRGHLRYTRLFIASLLRLGGRKTSTPGECPNPSTVVSRCFHLGLDLLIAGCALRVFAYDPSRKDLLVGLLVGPVIGVGECHEEDALKRGLAAFDYAFHRPQRDAGGFFDGIAVRAG